jgi:citrate synthase
LEPIEALDMSPVGRLATAAHVLAVMHVDDSPTDAARRLLVAAPIVLGARRRTGRFAHRLVSAWRAGPTGDMVDLVDAVDAALVLLADHELATSTLTVRIAASVHTTPYAGLAAAMATIEGRLHGNASAEAGRFLAACSAATPSDVLAQLRKQRRAVPGFGHKVYRGVDPRFTALAEHVRRVDPAEGALLDAVVRDAGRVLPHQPNVDLALGALVRAARLPPDAPVFAVARIAGWGAHFAEETEERPVRFRGVAAPKVPGADR